ncbi:MAG: glucosamine-6-phosphate deaminase [Bacilli bacterium]|nr:glucosamine-6-phosphate deaminase [Bacilli bacterium]
MKVIKVKNYEELSQKASEIIAGLMKEKNGAVLGLATGSTPIGTYKNLIKMYQNKEISFKNIKSYNLDEYCELPREHSESYYTFMHKNLFDHVDMQEENINMPSSVGADLEVLAKEYNDKLNSTSIDLQLLGIGGNGHIGFNEPGTSFDQETFIVELAEKTRQDNARFFNSIDEVPRHAITMGIKNIMNAKQILLLASGASKQEAVKKLVEGEITENFPASILKKHRDVIVIIDEEAGKLLTK